MADTYTYKERELPLKPHTSLLQAARWIASFIPPTEYKYEVFTKDYWPTDTELKKAKQTLCYDLMHGKLKTKGYQCIERGAADEFDWRLKQDATLVSIAKDSWIFDEIEWDYSALGYTEYEEVDDGFFHGIYQGGWRNIIIDTADLMLLHPQNASTQKCTIDKVALKTMRGTPFIQLMLEAIEHFKITEENQVGTKKLVPWFEDRLTKMGEKSPNNKAKMMATFVRSPDSQKGGNKKTK